MARRGGTAPAGGDGFPPEAPAGRRRRAPVRLARGLLRVLAGVAVVVALLLVAALVAIRTGAVREWAGELALDRLRDAVEGNVEVGRIGGDLLREVVLEDVVVTGRDGGAFLAVDRLAVEFELGGLLRREVLLGDVELVRPRIRLVRAADGTWNATRILPFLRGGDEPDAPGGWGSVVRLSDLRVSGGAVTLETAPEAGTFGPLGSSVAVSGLEGTFSLEIREEDGGARRDVEARDVSFTLAEPALQARELDLRATSTPGGLSFEQLLLRTARTEISAEGDVVLAGPPPPGALFPRGPTREQPLLDLRVAADPLSLAEAAPFVPALPFDEGTFRGRARLRGPADALELELEDGTLVTPGSRLGVSGRLTTEGGADVDATVSADPLDPADARALWDGWPLDHPLRGTVQVRGTAERVAVDGDVAWAATRAGFEGTVEPAGARPAYDLRVTVNDLDLRDFLDGETWRSRVNGEFRVAGAGLGGATEAALAGEIRDSRILLYDVAEGAFSGRFRPGAFEAESLLFRLARSEIRGSGIVSYDHTLAFDLRAVSRDVGDFYPALGTMPARRFEAVGTLEGPFQGLDLTVTAASADSLEWKGLVADTLNGTAALLDLGQPGFTMTLDATTASTHYGPIDLETAAFRAGFAGDTMGVTIQAQMDSLRTASGHLDVDFSGAAPLVVLDRGEVRLRTGAWAVEEPSGFAFQDGVFRFDDFALVHDGQRVAVDGTLRARGAQDLTFRADSLSLADVQAVLGTAAPVAGALEASGRLTGTDAAPVLESQISLAEGRVTDVGVHRLEGSLGYADRQLRVDLELAPETALADSLHDAAGVLAVRGTFPLNLGFHDVARRVPDEPMDLVLESRGTSLAVLESLTPQVREASGPLEISVRLRGRPSSPSYDGVVQVRNGAFRAGGAGVRYTGVSGAARFDNDEVVLENVVVQSPTGDARVEGRIAIRELTLGDVEVTLRARQFTVLESDGRVLIVDADLELGGTTLEPALTGVVNVDQLEWPLPESTDKDVIDLDEAIIYVRAEGDTTTPAPPPDIWRQTLLDLDVSIEDDAFLRSDRALLVMEGDLTIEKARGQDQPLIAGSLNVVRGFYSDFGAQFEVTEGEIFFYGTPELNPGLHVVAGETVENAATGQEVEVTLTVGGTLEEPTLNVTSVPEYEKSEIFSLLLFGTPYPGPGEEERFESTVTRVATRQAALPLQRALTSELGLDLLEIQPGLGVDGTRVRVGKYIQSNVFVTYSQAVGPREESQLGLQYRLSRSWTVETQAGTRQFGADLFYEFRY